MTDTDDADDGEPEATVEWPEDPAKKFRSARRFDWASIVGASEARWRAQAELLTGLAQKATDDLTQLASGDPLVIENVDEAALEVLENLQHALRSVVEIKRDALLDAHFGAQIALLDAIKKRAPLADTSAEIEALANAYITLPDPKDDADDDDDDFGGELDLRRNR